ncbi:MAG: PEP-CTERM sorting domain-containing protein [Pseudomonadota bacterium]
MNKAIVRFVLSVAAGCATSAAMAGSIDFENAPAAVYTELSLDGVTFTRGGEQFAVADWHVDAAPLAGRSLGTWRPFGVLNNAAVAFRAQLTGGFSSFSIGMGDAGADDDEGRLEAYDARGNLLATDSLSIAAGVVGGGVMSVSSTTPIAYVLFYEVGSYPGVVAWDNVSFTAAVPEPQTYVLMAAGLGAVGLLTRGRRG